MEVDHQMDQKEMKLMEDELMSELDEDDEEVAQYYRSNDDHLDSPWPSDDEDDEEFVVTDSFQESFNY